MDGSFGGKKETHFFPESRLQTACESGYQVLLPPPRKTNMSMENHYENNRTRDTSSFLFFLASHVSFPGVMLFMVQKSG